MDKKTISKKVTPVRKICVADNFKSTSTLACNSRGLKFKALSNGVKKEIAQYINILKQDKLPIKKVILFGSYAKGKQHKWSDIDLCIISPKFKDAFNALQYLSLKKPFNAKYAIGPIGFSPEDFKDRYSSLIYEIKTTGIEIPVK